MSVKSECQDGRAMVGHKGEGSQDVPNVPKMASPTGFEPVLPA